MLFMVCGVGMVALLIGSIAELLTQATSDARRAHAFRQKLMEVSAGHCWLRAIPRSTICGDVFLFISQGVLFIVHSVDM